MEELARVRLDQNAAPSEAAVEKQPPPAKKSKTRIGVEEGVELRSELRRALLTARGAGRPLCHRAQPDADVCCVFRY